MNLADIKKQKGLTNKSIGYRLNCSPSKAGMIMQGRYLHVYHDEGKIYKGTVPCVGGVE